MRTTSEIVLSKEDYLAGKKSLALTYRWGEPMTLEIQALTWRDLQRLTLSATERKLDQVEHTNLIVRASLIGDAPPNLIDMLEASSAGLLQRTALAFAFGQKVVPPRETTT